MTSSPMNDGVALLLARMKTNPEEFGILGKWNGLVGQYKEYLEVEDLLLLDKGVKELMQQRFTEQVMQELIDPKLKSPHLVMPSVTRLSTQTPIQYTADKIEALGLTPIAGVTQTL